MTTPMYKRLAVACYKEMSARLEPLHVRVSRNYGLSYAKADARWDIGTISLCTSVVFRQVEDGWYVSLWCAGGSERSHFHLPTIGKGDIPRIATVMTDYAEACTRNALEKIDAMCKAGYWEANLLHDEVERRLKGEG